MESKPLTSVQLKSPTRAPIRLIIGFIGQCFAFLTLSFVTVLKVQRHDPEAWFTAAFALLFFCTIALQTVVFVLAARDRFDSIDQRLTALTAELTELKSIKPP